MNWNPSLKFCTQSTPPTVCSQTEKDHNVAKCQVKIAMKFIHTQKKAMKPEILRTFCDQIILAKFKADISKNNINLV